MDRKNFVKKSALGLFAGSAFLSSCIRISKLPNEKDCELTGLDAMGPFFVKDTKQAINLNTQNLPGTAMVVSGNVYDGKGSESPISGAKIEIWHCDDNGAYHPNGSGDVDDYPAEKVTLRGFVITDDNGHYSFRSILPGLYGSRARHIHYKIKAKKHRPFITQSYFEGDERLEHDTLAQRAHDCRILSSTKSETGELLFTMNFNIK